MSKKIKKVSIKSAEAEDALGKVSNIDSLSQGVNSVEAARAAGIENQEPRNTIKNNYGKSKTTDDIPNDKADIDTLSTKPKTRWQKIKDSVSGFANKIINSTLVKGVIKAVTGKTALYAVAVVTAFVTTGPIGAAIVAGACVADLAIKTIKIDRTKKLHEESNAINQCRSDLAYKEAIRTVSPELMKNLESELSSTARNEQKKSATSKYKVNGAVVQGLKSIANQVIDTSLNVAIQGQALTVASTVENILKMDVVTLAKTYGPNACGTVANTYEHLTEQQARTAIKNNINKERAKKDAPTYDDLYELKTIAYKNRVEAAALAKLLDVRDKNYFLDATPAEQLERFKHAKEFVDKEMKGAPLKTSSGFGSDVKGFFKAIGRALDPDCAYKSGEIKKLPFIEKSHLALAQEKMNDEKAKKDVFKNSQPNIDLKSAEQNLAMSKAELKRTFENFADNVKLPKTKNPPIPHKQKQPTLRERT